jgi:hypothetical protein
MYVIINWHAAEECCEDSLLAKTVSCRDGDLTSGNKIPQVGEVSRDHGHWRACQEGFAGSTKGRLSAACHSPLAACRAQRLQVAAHPSLA